MIHDIYVHRVVRASGRVRAAVHNWKVDDQTLKIDAVTPHDLTAGEVADLLAGKPVRIEEKANRTVLLQKVTR